MFGPTLKWVGLLWSKIRVMEIVNLKNDVFQVIDHSGSVLYQGTYDDCECYVEDFYREQHMDENGY